MATLNNRETFAMLNSAVLKTRFRPALALAFAYLAISAVLRIALWWLFGRGDGVEALQLPGILALGTVNDAVEPAIMANS